MSDLKTRIYNILKEPQLVSLATLTLEGTPWVRYVVAKGDENLTIRFASVLESRKIQQIEANPEVHLTCGVGNLEEMSPYLQVLGKARVSTDQHERNKFWNDKMKSTFTGPDDPKYCVVVIEPYRIEYCTQSDYEPDVWIRSME